MARIRSIKPEFWVDDVVVDLDLLPKLLYIGLWNFADDDGYIEASPRRIKRLIFPDNNYDIEGALKDLVRVGRLVEFDSDQGAILQVVNFHKHQKPQHPTATKYTNIRAALRSSHEDYRKAHEPSLRSVVEGSGVESREVNSSSSIDDGFNSFWTTYPRKIAKGAAVKSYKAALKKTTAETILKGAQRYKLETATAEAQFIAHPASWLNAERWDDESSRPAKRADPDAWMNR